MFDEQLGQLNQSINDFLSSDVFQIGVRVLVIYFVLVWLASAFWAYRDMRQRSTSALAPYVAAAIIILFTPIFFLFGLLLYRIVRPKETIAEANERLLTEEAILAEVQSRPHCANCMRPVHDEWIICPTCRNRLRRVCPNCEHLVELDWSLCAWCGRDFERSEAPGTAYMPRARRQPAPVPVPASAPMPASAPTPATGPAPARPAAPRPTYSRPNPAPTTGNAGSGTAPSATPAQRPGPQSASTPTPAQPRPATGER
jgi:RNA polymerase subunit RPABC4/transcription elongation factor Spt4